MSGSAWPFILFLIAVYLLPTIIAEVRHHHQAGMVAAINVFLGWTLIGWVVALAIACSYVPREEAEQATKVCPACAEEVKAAAKICRFCRHEFAS